MKSVSFPFSIRLVLKSSIRVYIKGFEMEIYAEIVVWQENPFFISHFFFACHFFYFLQNELIRRMSFRLKSLLIEWIIPIAFVVVKIWMVWIHRNAFQARNDCGIHKRFPSEFHTEIDLRRLSLACLKKIFIVLCVRRSENDSIAFVSFFFFIRWTVTLPTVRNGSLVVVENWYEFLIT